MQTQTFNKTKFKDSVNDLIQTLKVYGEDGEISNISFDLVEMSVTEFIGSKKFAELDGSRRQELFYQYGSLKIILESLAKFVNKYPDFITISELELEEE